MNKIILLVLTALIMVGCDNKTDAKKIEEANRLNGFNIVVIDSCEYLIKTRAMGYQGFGYFAHKGNCRFCAERRKQELESLIEQIKGKRYESKDKENR